jgi:hypothetical protein
MTVLVSTARAGLGLAGVLLAAAALPAAAHHEPPRPTSLSTGSYRVVTTGICMPAGYACAGLGHQRVSITLRDAGGGAAVAGGVVVVRDADSDHVHCRLVADRFGAAACNVPDLDVLRHGSQYAVHYAGDEHHLSSSAAGAFRFP